MGVNEAFQAMAEGLAEKGFLAELIYTMKRTARVSLARGGRACGVIFNDLADLKPESVAEVLEVMAGRLTSEAA